MRRRGVLAIVCVLAVSAEAAADPADELRAALARLPAPQGEELKRPVLAHFVDISALVATAAGDPGRLRDLGERLMGPAPSEAMMRIRIAAGTGEMQWLGADPASFRSVIGWTVRDRGDTAVWRLQSADSVATLLSGLRNHRPVPGAAAGLLSDPRPPAEVGRDLMDRSPWYEGRDAARPIIAGAGDVLLQAPSAEGIASLRAVTQANSFGQDPAVRTLLRSFADAPGRILQAFLLSPQIAALQDAPDLRLQPAVVAGMPPWRFALIADLQIGELPALAVALAYADCAAARVAEERLALLWFAAEAPGFNQRYSAVTPAEARSLVVVENRQCAAGVLIRAQSVGPRSIPPFVLAAMALDREDFPFLRIVGVARR